MYRKLKRWLRVWWHELQCKRGNHVWELGRTVVGHNIGGRYYHQCKWCGRVDWNIDIDKEHQK